MTRSCLYEGIVEHRREEPRVHAFRYRLFLVYLDLEELPGLFDRHWLWSARRPSLLWFRRSDYLGPHDRSLRDAVLDRVTSGIGRRPAGPVRVLTNLRTFGYVFNPVTFYYCFDESERLEAVAAEITNTPWGERHTYVVDARGAREGERVEQRFPKVFHVSPFHGMELEYDWSFSAPGEELEVRMRNRDGGRSVFRADLLLERRALSSAALARVLLTYPLQPLRLHAAIYLQAARLFWKRMPFHAHPREPVGENRARTS